MRAGTITTTVALDMTETAIPNYVWGGNGYHTISGVNGVTVEECATVTQSTQNDVTLYNVQIDLFFTAAAMEDTFRIVIFSDAGTYMTYGDTVANSAYQLATKTDNEFADNAEALLYYGQKACDCILHH